MPKMLRNPAALALGALLLGSIAAQASEATSIAERAGFLLGHAQRCGVSEARLELMAAYSKKLIGAFALDEDDRRAAQSQFAERVLASALAAALGDPLPACAAVKSQLEQLERHSQETQRQGGSQMARQDGATGKPAASSRSANAKPARSARPATTRREELTPERRAELELQRTAHEARGRPPSI